MEATTAAALGAIATGAATGLGVLLKAWVDRSRVEQVEGPRTANEAWQVVFQTMQEQISGLGRRIAALEVDLRAAHSTIADRDRTIATRDETIEACNSTIRRLREYVAIVTDLLATNGIAFPEPPDDHGLAPERRAPIATVAIDHHTPPSKENPK